MELQIFKNDDDYNKVVMQGASAEFYVTTLNGYDYVMHEPNLFRYINGMNEKPNLFRYINGMNEKREINPMNIDRVIRTRDTVIVILNLDSYAHNIIWDDILND